MSAISRKVLIILIIHLLFISIQILLSCALNIWKEVDEGKIETT